MTVIDSGRRVRVLRPGDEAWDTARLAWNLSADQQPEAIVYAESAAEAAAAVEVARAEDLRVAVQGTGHGATSMGSLEGTLLLRTDKLRSITIDAQAGTARVGAGVLWIEVVEAAARYGLAPLAGSSPDVGVVGYTLGGGLSWLGRKHGLAAHALVAAEVVTADGDVIRADENQNTDLLWALRGGGGNYAAVTEVEIRLFPHDEVYAGILWFPFERAAEVLHAWAELTRNGLPDELTTVGRLLQLPPLPDIPEPVRGKSFVIVEAIYSGRETTEADRLLEPLRALGPVMDTVGPISLPELSRLHMDPEHPVPGVGDGAMLAELPVEAVDAFLAAAGPGSGSRLLSVELRQLGGALGRPRPEHAALPAVDAAYAMYAVGIGGAPEMAAASEFAVGGVKAALEPWLASHMVPNFAETRRDPRAFWPGETYDRLVQVKEAYDPENVFRSNHPLFGG